VAAIPPPANDNFANATTIGSLRFFDQTDRRAATMETGEPVFTSCGQISHTIWYRYTPTADQIVYGSGNAPGVNTFIAVYTGSSLANLTEMDCALERNVFQVKAGTTYYIQVGSYDGQNGAPQTFSLDIAPLPSPAVLFNPTDPSTFDTTQFSAFVFDPAASGSVQSERWDFGDGSAADGFSVSHQYAADDTYEVTLTVTMTDGRVATARVPLAVKTHDVAISKLLARRRRQSDRARRSSSPSPARATRSRCSSRSRGAQAAASPTSARSHSPFRSGRRRSTSSATSLPPKTRRSARSASVPLRRSWAHATPCPPTTRSRRWRPA
jgi:PKD domain